MIRDYLRSPVPSAEDEAAHRRLPVRRPLRIVHVVSSLQVGGMEQFVLRLASEQQRRAHQVSLLALRGGPLLQKALEAGLPVRQVGPCPKALRILRAAGWLTRLRPDIVHAHNSVAVRYALLGRLLRRPKALMTRHGQEEINPLPSRLRLRHLDAVVAVSDAAAKAMLAKRPGCANKLAVIHNGIDRAPARPRAAVRADLGLGGGEVTAVMVARMDHLKGHDVLLRALAALRSRGLPLTLLLAGDGAERPRLEALVGLLGLDRDRVRFLGLRADVPDLLAAADFFVLPSLTEGLPLSVLEAMSQGLPVVASAVGGVPELLTHGEQGLLVPPSDVEALAEALTCLATKPELRREMGAAARQRTVEQFSFQRMVEEYDDLYHRLRA